MLVVPVPCLSDNYAYLLIAPLTNECMIIDPSEGPPVVAAVKDRKARDGRVPEIRAILATHHHPDHVGGVLDVVRDLAVPEVYGYESDRGRIPGQTQFLKDGDTITFADAIISAMHIPGHTLGAVAYIVRAKGEDPIVFTGDTLFVGGCGRVFEGDPQMMQTSLAKLAALPPDTRVFCGHEYTESNYRFAAMLEPSNVRLEQARERAGSLRLDKKPTVPSTIEEERATNPFLRLESAELRKALKIDPKASLADAFGKVRGAKDVFRPSAPMSK